MPRRGLTAGKVVATAAEIADEHGYDRLTLATLAAALGVRVPSLYKHVDGLDDLRERVALLAGTELAAEVEDGVRDRDGRDALFAAARAYRRFATSRPGRFCAMVRAPRQLRAGDVAARADLLTGRLVRDCGIAEPEVELTALVIRSTLRGIAMGELRGDHGVPERADALFEHSLAMLDDALTVAAGRNRRRPRK